MASINSTFEWNKKHSDWIQERLPCERFDKYFKDKYFCFARVLKSFLVYQWNYFTSRCWSFKKSRRNYDAIGQLIIELLNVLQRGEVQKYVCYLFSCSIVGAEELINWRRPLLDMIFLSKAVWCFFHSNFLRSKDCVYESEL